MISKSFSRKLSILVAVVMLVSLLVPALPASAAVSKVNITGVEFDPYQLGKVTITTDKAASLSDLVKFVKLSGRQAQWQAVGNNTYAATFSGLKYDYKYTLSATSKFAFKGVTTKDRQYKWSQDVQPPQQQQVQLTLGQSSVSVEQGQSADVAYTVNPADAVVTATSSNTAVATVAVSSGKVTITGVAPGTATITVTATKSGYVSATSIISVEVKPAELKVTAARAVNKKQVRVEFNREVGSVLPANFSVFEKGNEYAIRVIESVAADGNKVNISLVDPLGAGKTYVVRCLNVTAKESGVTPLASADLEFAYSQQQPASIAFKRTVYAGNELLEYVITDAEGNDITANYTTADLELESSSNVVNAGTFKTVVVGSTGYAVVNLKIKNTTIQTGNTIITVKPSLDELTSLGRWTIAQLGQGIINYENPKTFLYLNEGSYKLWVEALNQKGEPMTTGVTFTYRSLTPTVAVVEESGNGNNAGKITPISVGTASILVTAASNDGQQVSKVISFPVKEAPKPTSISLSKTAVTLVKGSGISAEISVSIIDQYGNKIDTLPGGAELKATIKSAEKDVIGADATEGWNQDTDVVFKSLEYSSAQATLELKPGEATNLPASATVDVVYDDGSTKLTRSIAVTLVAPGQFAGYAVEVPTTKLDLNQNGGFDKRQGLQKVEVRVYQKDTNGNYIEKVSNFEIYDEDEGIGGAVEVEVNTDSRNVTARAVGTEKVYVKVGNVTVATLTFTVVDSTPVLTTVVQKKSAISVTTNDELASILFGLDRRGGDVFVGYDQYGDKIELYNELDLNFTSWVYTSNSSVVEVRSNAISAKDSGTATLVIKLANKIFTLTVVVTE